MLSAFWKNIIREYVSGLSAGSPTTTIVIPLMNVYSHMNANWWIVKRKFENHSDDVLTVYFVNSMQ